MMLLIETSCFVDAVILDYRFNKFYNFLSFFD